MLFSHPLKTSHREMIASVTEDLADDVFIDEAARKKNKETIDKYMKEIKELDERLEKLKQHQLQKQSNKRQNEN